MTQCYFISVEKQIEQGTAVKLEGSIAMREKPIYNSVKKWADRAISGAKSVLVWFSIGRKKNEREIIERTEKQQRDHF